MAPKGPESEKERSRMQKAFVENHLGKGRRELQETSSKPINK